MRWLVAIGYSLEESHTNFSFVHANTRTFTESAMACWATFSFIKGECVGRVITHKFERSSTVAEMKSYLIQTHNACNPDSHALVFVWDEQMRKLTEDNQSVASLGETVNITVNLVRKIGSWKPSDAHQQHHVSFAGKASVVEQDTHNQVSPGPAIDPPVHPGASSLSSLPPPAHTPASAAAQPLALQLGSRVRIEGLTAAPEMNGRRGVVCEEFNAQTGRWSVNIDADGPKPACRGVFRPVNLKLLRNFSSEWEDEDGCVWPKNVDFTRQCPKGHLLALRDNCPASSASNVLPTGWVEGFDVASKRPFYNYQGIGNCCWERPGSRVMCRICRVSCMRSSAECATWRMCSAVAGCCGSYAVCGSCAGAPSRDAHVPVRSDDFCTMVSSLVSPSLVICNDSKHHHAGYQHTISGRHPFSFAPFLWPFVASCDHFSVLPNVHTTLHLAQPRQPGACADTRK